jgi:hypothetical protein
MGRVGIWFLAVLAILALGSTAMAQEKAKAEITVKETKEAAEMAISRLVVGTAMENREPKGVAEAFPATTEKVFCFLEASNIPKDMELTFVWTYKDKEIHKTTLPVKASAKWRTFASKTVKGMKGDWKVEVKDSTGKSLKDVKFKIE